VCVCVYVCVCVCVCIADYTVEVMNRFGGLDLVNRVPEELVTLKSHGLNLVGWEAKIFV